MTQSIKVYSTTNAPAAIGPYSQAIEANGFVFLSGQLGVDPATSKLQVGIEAQTQQLFKNIQAVLKVSDRDLSRVVKVTVFLMDLANFNTMNQIYESYFGNHKPARSTIQVARLPRDADIEIEVTAY